MKKRSFYILTGLFIAILFTASEAAAAPYYQGKAVTIVVGYGPGGGYDRVARVMAKHLVQYLPAEDTLKLINALLNQPPDIINEFSKYVKF